MATYKVIQDIEAEDHILGPLSLRQFIFGIVAVMCFYFTYLVISKHVGFLAVIFLPPGLFAAFFAFPFGKDQPTEVWALAKLRFMFKPRKRIWDQSGIKNLVTVTAPKRVEIRRTDGLSQGEVRSRLNALANTIDSRGWAVKNVNLNMYAAPGTLVTGAASDRLVEASSVPQEVMNYDVRASDDIMDAQNNPIAQQFDQMITASAQAHRQQVTNLLNDAQNAGIQLPVPPALPAQQQPPQPQNNAPANYWFLNQATPQGLPSTQVAFAAPPVVAPGTDEDETIERHAANPTADEVALGKKLKAEHDHPVSQDDHLKHILPLDQQKHVAQAAEAVAPSPSLATKQLMNNNDLNISTIQREAGRTNNPSGHFDDDEVVVSFH